MEESEKITIYVRLGEEESKLVSRAAQREGKGHNQWAKQVLLREAAKEIVPLLAVERLLEELGLSPEERAAKIEALREEWG